MHIFGIPWVHRVLLCIWLPHHMGVLTLLKDKTRRGDKDIISCLVLSLSHSLSGKFVGESAKLGPLKIGTIRNTLRVLTFSRVRNPM